MKIYTKKGDKCNTTLVGGVGVSKIHPRIEAYGTVDELIAHVGLLRDMLPILPIKDELLQLQDKLMIAAALLAYDRTVEVALPSLKEENVVWLEHSIDNGGAVNALKQFPFTGWTYCCFSIACLPHRMQKS
jgi:cob(I)alamin adenosyltransferase